ncbi:hypothetical protein DAPK24_021290 [Pichia kluyveri]|uniref:Uncharacterized protein n=1 Tax=Pichia kluyveri TaxID=36015 RepID=A0AAV5R2A3_PICKL|nr:hypothetical protein DAPK24_021290 [Pichia kluyveri]
MSLLGSLKCIICSALLFGLFYHVQESCPIGKPLPLTPEPDAVCVNVHSVAQHVIPYYEISKDYILSQWDALVVILNNEDLPKSIKKDEVIREEAEALNGKKND